MLRRRAKMCFRDIKARGKTSQTRGLFLKSPEIFRAYFGRHNSLCIFKTKASRGTKLCSYFFLYSLYNISKNQLYRISRSHFYEWLFGPAKFSGLLRNRAQSREATNFSYRTLSVEVGIETSDLFLESLENFSDPKSHL